MTPTAPTRTAPWLRARSFAGRVAVVSGSDGGIGRSICEGLAALGAIVVGCDLGPPLEEGPPGTVPVGDAGGSITRCPTDVRVPAEVDAAVASAVEAHGGVDIVVGCAGVVRPSRLADVDHDGWRTSFDVNVDGMLHLARAAYPHLQRSPAPAVVTVASLSGLSAYPGGGGYGPSKAALISISRQLAVEWGGDGIRVNVVAPGPTVTPMLLAAQPEEYRATQAARAPLGRLAAADEVADAVLYLLSDGARAVTGQVLAVDCGTGQTLLRGVDSPRG